MTERYDLSGLIPPTGATWCPVCRVYVSAPHAEDGSECGGDAKHIAAEAVHVTPYALEMALREDRAVAIKSAEEALAEVERVSLLAASEIEKRKAAERERDGWKADHRRAVEAAEAALAARNVERFHAEKAESALAALRERIEALAPLIEVAEALGKARNNYDRMFGALEFFDVHADVSEAGPNLRKLGKALRALASVERGAKP